MAMFFIGDLNHAYLLTFTVLLKNKRLHINRILASLLLFIFAIALTPWSSLHHHEEEDMHGLENTKTCMHKVHIGIERHNCLICSAHFAKDVITPEIQFVTFHESKTVIRNFNVISTTYVALISTSLRGPPEV
jgi:hypothetical protein